jgi:hypothetical protein
VVFVHGLHIDQLIHTGLYDEGGPPTEIADLINASFPNHLLKLIHQMLMKRVIEYDKLVTPCRTLPSNTSLACRETVEGLNRVGFKTNNGDDDSGFLTMAWERGGGYYLGAIISSTYALTMCDLITTPTRRRWSKPAYHRWQD